MLLLVLLLVLRWGQLEQLAAMACCHLPHARRPPRRADVLMSGLLLRRVLPGQRARSQMATGGSYTAGTALCCCFRVRDRAAAAAVGLTAAAA